MTSVRVLLSAFTLFGGHFFNRRLDRVVLIGTLVVLAAIGSVGTPVVLSILANDPTFSYFTAGASVLLALVIAIALLSAWLTFRDARQPPVGPLTTTIRITRLPVTLLGALVISIAVITVVWLHSVPVYHTYSEREQAAPTMGHIEFGSAATARIENFREPLADGPERLRGRVLLDDKGVDGAKLSVEIDGALRGEVESDSHGVFEVRLPAGTHHVNEITVSDWDARPKERTLIPFSGHEQVNRGGLYSRFNYLLADGLEVTLPAAADATPIEIEFRDALAVSWPPPRDPLTVPNPRGPPDADLSTAAITWQPVKGAVEYSVQIAHVGQDDLSRSFPEDILTRRLSGTTLPLAPLPQRPARALSDEYAVHIYAFDAAGKLLTETNQKESDDPTFMLTGAMRLGKERQYVGMRVEHPEVISEEYEANEQRLELAAKLLDKKRLDDARVVLEQVTKDAPRGRAAALRGKLLALQGNCAAALELFAESECQSGCGPVAERKLCETAGTDQKPRNGRAKSPESQ